MSYGMGEVPSILQGAAQREDLNPQQAALVQSYQQPVAGTSNNLTILLILAGIAAFLFLGKARGGMTA